MATEPEIYYCGPTRFVPNSRLPILIYRNVLPQPITEETTGEFLEKNNWVKRGTWGAISRHHFHPNTHECYGVYQGSSTLLLGTGPLDKEEDGQTIYVEKGDVIVLPAGTAHCSKDFKDDYRYVGVYPDGSPKWRNEYGEDESRYDDLKTEAESVAIPEWDPVNGLHGPLWRLWSR
ncbi:hypothetical protein VTN31DRAFT_7007 [Thermomyces dupontii]|uniref:uncharacterized protein n=1 Tax=Talaromyces thermophilus TaxID=28565 RepID=UPI0037424EF9